MLLLLVLGFWQIERLFWQRKADRAAAGGGGSAAPIGGASAAWKRRSGMEFRRMFADEGVFLHDKEIFLGAASGGGRARGLSVLTPLQEGRAAASSLSIAASSPGELKDPATRPAGQIVGTVQVAGPAASAAGGKAGRRF